MIVESIKAYFADFLIDMPYYILLIGTFLALFLSSKRATIPMLLIIFSMVGCVIYLLISTKILYFILFLCLFILLAVLSKKKTLNFAKGILSVSSIINSFFVKRDKESKFIGRILPYAEWQIKHNKKLIRFSDTAAKGTTLITGSVGSGKTYGMESLIYQDMKNGHSVVFLDFKGEYDIVTRLKSHAKKFNIEVYEMSNKLINFNYDPLSTLNKAARVETLLNTRKWSMDGSDAHYRTNTQLLIQKVINEFEKVWDNKTNYLVSLYNFVKTYECERSLFDGYNTLLKILEIIITSNINSAWLGKNEKDFSFDIKEQYLLILSFVSSNKELANSLSSFIFKDLLDQGTEQTYNPGLSLYIDEFGTLENSFIIKDILEKGRSCGVQTTLALQDVNQIVINTNQAYLNSILGTINTFIIYSGAIKSTAELMAGVQLGEIDRILMSLRKPSANKAPTAMYISKYPSVEKEKTVDVFKIIPYIDPEMKMANSNIEPKIAKEKIEVEKPIEKEFEGRKQKNINYDDIMKNIKENKETIFQEVDHTDFL